MKLPGQSVVLVLFAVFGLGVAIVTVARSNRAVSSDDPKPQTAAVATPPPATRPATTRPVIYIASPYSQGDPAINTHFQCEMWDRLMTDGKVWPVAPLWSHFQHTLFPRKYEDWVGYDLAMIPRYDACLRVNPEYPRVGYAETKSSGADKEVEEFQRLSKPVFFSVDELYRWVDGQQP